MNKQVITTSKGSFLLVEVEPDSFDFSYNAKSKETQYFQPYKDTKIKTTFHLQDFNIEKLIGKWSELDVNKLYEIINSAFSEDLMSIIIKSHWKSDTIGTLIYKLKDNDTI